MTARPARRVSLLFGVRCTSSAKCWAVGGYTKANGAFVNQALHWNGRMWSPVATPNPGGTGAGAFNALNGVTCTTSANCWAVGSYGNGNGPSLNQALHWNGRTWSRVPTRNPGIFNMSTGVACTTSTDCWAVGLYVNGRGAGLNQALHWNGRTWSRVPTPDPNGTGPGASNTLNGLPGLTVCCGVLAGCRQKEGG